jgi:hypothetical protein
MDKTGTVQGLSFNAKYEKMDREKKPEIVKKVGDVEVKERSIYNNIVLVEGTTRKGWVDETGKEYPKEQVKYYDEQGELTEKSQTKEFEITGFQPITAYTDMYVIAKYYEIFPDDDGRTKDFEKELARKKNLVGMRKLWDHLEDTQQVARAEFNTSSRGFVASDGYIRAIKFGNKWGLEIGVFSEEKVFRHLQEGIPEPVLQGQSNEGTVRRIKRI